MKYKTDIKRICHLAWPAIIQEAMNTIVTYVDTAMVGAMGATASAAVGCIMMDSIQRTIFHQRQRVLGYCRQNK